MVLQWSALGDEALSLSSMLAALQVRTAAEAQSNMSVWQIPNFNIVWPNVMVVLRFASWA